MASFVFTDASVVINSVDLSDHVLSCTVNYAADLQEDTSMGDTSKTRLSGLTDWSLDVNFKQDFATGKVDATLFGLIGGAAVTATVKPASGAVSGTNPSYSGSVILESYPPLSGNIGDLAQVSVTFQGSGALTRAVA